MRCYGAWKVLIVLIAALNVAFANEAKYITHRLNSFKELSRTKSPRNGAEPWKVNNLDETDNSDELYLEHEPLVQPTVITKRPKKEDTQFDLEKQVDVQSNKYSLHDDEDDVLTTNRAVKEMTEPFADSDPTVVSDETTRPTEGLQNNDDQRQPSIKIIIGAKNESELQKKYSLYKDNKDLDFIETRLLNSTGTETLVNTEDGVESTSPISVVVGQQDSEFSSPTPEEKLHLIENDILASSSKPATRVIGYIDKNTEIAQNEGNTQEGAKLSQESTQKEDEESSQRTTEHAKEETEKVIEGTNSNDDIENDAAQEEDILVKSNEATGQLTTSLLRTGTRKYNITIVRKGTTSMKNDTERPKALASAKKNKAQRIYKGTNKSHLYFKNVQKSRMSKPKVMNPLVKASEDQNDMPTFRAESMPRARAKTGTAVPDPLQKDDSENESVSAEDIVPKGFGDKVYHRIEGGATDLWASSPRFQTTLAVSQVGKQSTRLSHQGYRRKYKYRLPAEVTHTEVADNMARTVRVLCWVMTSSEHHDTRAQAVKDTWGKRCNVLLFISDKYNASLPALSMPVPHEEDFRWGTTKEAFRYAYKHHNQDADWFLKADDDTYVIVENLRYLLFGFNPEHPLYLGYRFKPFVQQGFMSGGAGYVLSRKALKRLVKTGLARPDLCLDGVEGSPDIEMGKCLEKLDVRVADTRDSARRERFMPFLPENHMFPVSNKSFWYWSYAYNPIRTGTDCCSDYAVSFHYVPPHEMLVLDYLIYKLHVYGIRTFS